MSIFTPQDPRGPDQRRKQLIAKLAGQAGAAQQAVGRIPMPSRLAPAMAEGRSFHGASTTRLGGATHVTQNPNILASVMQRLGVLGRSHAEEMSGGHGLPIAPPAPSANAPLPPQGSAIPTPNAGASAGIGQSPAPFQASPGTVGQQVPNGVDSIQTPGGQTTPDLGFLMGDSGPVPLGNGLYYDPASGTILGQQDVNPTIPGARSGKNAPI